MCRLVTAALEPASAQPTCVPAGLSQRNGPGKEDQTDELIRGAKPDLSWLFKLCRQDCVSVIVPRLGMKKVSGSVPRTSSLEDQVEGNVQNLA